MPNCSAICCDDDAPLVFHCTAGKDRTGFAAALILSALGVPLPVVMQDYLLTNDFYRQPKAANGFASQDVLDVLWQVQADFLEAAAAGGADATTAVWTAIWNSPSGLARRGASGWSSCISSPEGAVAGLRSG